MDFATPVTSGAFNVKLYSDVAVPRVTAVADGRRYHWHTVCHLPRYGVNDVVSGLHNDRVTSSPTTHPQIFTKIESSLIKILCPRKGVDMENIPHQRGPRVMNRGVERLAWSLRCAKALPGPMYRGVH